MIFRKRLYFFSIGLIIGIFLVIFVFQGKNASFNYMPNSRVIQNITSKDSIQFTDKNNAKFTNGDIKEIILSIENKKDIEEIKKIYLRGIKFIYVENMFEVINYSITNKKVPNSKFFKL